MRVTIDNVRFYISLYNENRRHDMPAYSVQSTNNHLNIVEFDVTKEGYTPRSFAANGLTTREAYHVAVALFHSVYEVR